MSDQGYQRIWEKTDRQTDRHTDGHTDRQKLKTKSEYELGNRSLLHYPLWSHNQNPVHEREKWSLFNYCHIILHNILVPCLNSWGDFSDHRFYGEDFTMLHECI